MNVCFLPKADGKSNKVFRLSNNNYQKKLKILAKSFYGTAYLLKINFILKKYFYKNITG